MKSLSTVLKRNGMFLKLVASFLTIIGVVSLTFGFITNRVYLRRIEGEVAANAEQRFLKSASILDGTFDALKSDIYTRTLDAIDLLIKPDGLDMYDLVSVRSQLAGLKNRNPWVANVVLIVPDFDFIVDVNGSIAGDSFFNVFYMSERYSIDFWTGELSEKFSNRVYRARRFDVYGGPAQMDSLWYLPLSFRDARDSDYLIIVLLSVDTIRRELDLGSEERFRVTGSEGILLALGHDYIGNDEAGDGMYDDDLEAYEFGRRSESLQLGFESIVPTFYVRERLGDINLLNKMIFSACVAFAIALSLLFARHFNSPIKRMVELLEQSGGVNWSRRTGNMHYILDGVRTVIRRNQRIEEDLGIKRSVLDVVLLQAVIQNIINLDSNTIRDVEHWFTGAPGFVMILFYVHRHGMHHSSDSERASFLDITREIVERYLEEIHPASFSFIVSHRSIVSLLDMSQVHRPPRELARRIVNKLNYENSHLYFTVVVSSKHDGVHRLPDVYKRLNELYYHRSLCDESMVLFEGEKQPASVSTFSYPEQKHTQLKNLLQKGDVDGVRRVVESVLTGNIDAGVSSLGIARLCTEILHTCEVAIVGMQSDILSDFPVESYLHGIDECNTREEFLHLCIQMVDRCIFSLENATPDSDRILVFTKAFMHEKYAEIIYFEEIAERLHITRTYLSTYFKQKTGISLSDYLNTLRVQKAANFLQGSVMKIKDIGVLVGIPNMTTFARVFRRFTGQTPKEYRQAAALRSLTIDSGES